MKPPTPELRKLVDQLLDEREMSRVDTSRLEDLIRDEDAMRYYAEMVTHEAMMEDALDGITGVKRKRPGNVLRFPLVKVALGAAAAAVVFAAGFFSRPPEVIRVEMAAKVPKLAPEAEPEPDPSDPPEGSEPSLPLMISYDPPARITGLTGVEWADGGEPDLLESHGQVRQLSIRTGLVELTYSSGVRVTLEGPVDYSIVDETSGRLTMGKLVAYVPKGAEGFHVDYAKGRVVDLGTEFAMDVHEDGKTELGVFEGKVQLHVPGQDVRLLQVNQALMHDEKAEDVVSSIPLDRDKFVRRMPARDFRWEVTSGAPKQFEVDVTHLIWKSGTYRPVFKWMQGPASVEVRNVMLLRDGVEVCRADGRGATGPPRRNLVADNLFTLPVASGQYEPGRWTLRATLRPVGGGSQCVGIVQFEEGLITTATEADFIGTWRYFYGGIEHKRQFMPDGTMRFYKGGRLATENFVNGHWHVTDGILYQEVPEGGFMETHALRNKDTLIFVNRPYDNAVRVEDP
ncbi:MAG: FecR domain-containing protein [Luteolibacter sp.]